MIVVIVVWVGTGGRCVGQCFEEMHERFGFVECLMIGCCVKSGKIDLVLVALLKDWRKGTISLGPNLIDGYERNWVGLRLARLREWALFGSIGSVRNLKREGNLVLMDALLGAIREVVKEGLCVLSHEKIQMVEPEFNIFVDSLNVCPGVQIKERLRHHWVNAIEPNKWVVGTLP
ncbi:hypothetical protein Tco_0227747 [Tanacetum coccineum]